MIRYMLDTNACIAVINSRPPAVRIRLLELDPIAVAVSEIVRYELAFGVCNSSMPERHQANLTHFLRYVQVLEWTEAQSVAAAQIRCDLAREGRPIGHYDTLIAAHARSLDACLVTNNTREFSRVAGLQIEDWTLPRSASPQSPSK